MNLFIYFKSHVKAVSIDRKHSLITPTAPRDIHPGEGYQKPGDSGQFFIFHSLGLFAKKINLGKLLYSRGPGGRSPKWDGKKIRGRFRKKINYGNEW